MGFVGLNLRTFSGVPAWSNVHARIVEGITDMMIYVILEVIDVLRGVGILVLIPLRGEAEEDLLTQPTQNVPQPNTGVFPVPAPPNTEFLRFPVRPHSFWSYLISFEECQVHFVYTFLSEDQLSRQDWGGGKCFAAMGSFIPDWMSSLGLH